MTQEKAERLALELKLHVRAETIKVAGSKSKKHIEVTPSEGCEIITNLKSIFQFVEYYGLTAYIDAKGDIPRIIIL